MVVGGRAFVVVPIGGFPIRFPTRCDAASDRTCLLKIADRDAEARLTHRIRGTHGHGGLPGTRDGLMIRTRREFLPHLRICDTFRTSALANAR